MFGGFDGVNIFDFDTVNMNDWATSTDNDSDVVGKASLTGYESALDTYDSTGTGDTIQGAGLANNIVFAYKSAVDLVLDDATGVASVICLPGIKDPVITNHVMTKTRDYGRALYLMDIPSFATDGQRLYRASVDGIKKADVDVTISSFAARNIDNNYVATYFPDVVMVDKSDDLLRNPNNAANIRSIHLPSSIAALGALARSEGADTPWFAPAGFTKGALPNVTGVATRLKALDRDNLYEARINPIATFPGNEYVIFGQKTLQLANTALTRVNVRRLLVAIKRKIEIDAQALLFQQNTVTTRNRFKQSVESYLADVRIKQGIENFRVVINDDPQEADNNILSGKIIVVPTRVVEFIAMDFVVTNSGVTFA
jgi:phage tail sheath protein FI